MKKAFYPVLAALLLVSSAFVSSITSTEWKIKEDFSIKFTSKDPSGSFSKFTGTILFDESDLAGSKFDLTIPVSSISTGNGMMNKKAQIEEWFNAGKYPNIHFVSTKVDKSENGYVVVGALKMKGTSKDMKIPVVFKSVNGGAVFSGTFRVKRSDFKIGKESEAVPDIMKIEFNIPVAKK